MGRRPLPTRRLQRACVYQPGEQEDEPIPDEYQIDENDFVQYVLMTMHATGPDDEPIYPCGKAVESLSFDYELCSSGVSYLCLAPGTSSDATVRGSASATRKFIYQLDAGVVYDSNIPAHVSKPMPAVDVLPCQKTFTRAVAASLFPDLPVGSELCSKGVHYLCLGPGSSVDASGFCRPKSSGRFSPSDCSAQCIYSSDESVEGKDASETIDERAPALAPRSTRAYQYCDEMKDYFSLHPDSAVMCSEGDQTLLYMRGFLCLSPGTSGDATGGCRAWRDGPFSPTTCSAQCIYKVEEFYDDRYQFYQYYQYTDPDEPATIDELTPGLVPESTRAYQYCDETQDYFSLRADGRVMCGEGDRALPFLCLSPGTSGGDDATGGCRAWRDGPFPSTTCGAQCVYKAEEYGWYDDGYQFYQYYRYVDPDEPATPDGRL
ncbi:hypothetical protein FOA52_009163 [Chlamydomonas sp. UWO 241]|nr:hypothetical protein FOA52_009163 [Chlamydomonas sp. UWO 241]